MAEGGRTEKSAVGVIDTPGASAAEGSRSVFISYASQDAEVANAACRFLEGRGVPCWIAPRDVKPGAQYAEAIVGAISEAKVMVLVMSANAMLSSHVRREVERAASKRKPVIAFRIDAAALNPALEYFLSESQWIDVPTLGLQAALAKLAGAVGSIPTTMAQGASAGNHPVKGDLPHKIPRRTMAWITATALAAILAVVAILVFVSLRKPANSGWRDPLADAKVMRLTDFTGTEQSAAISRDGRYVAFLADRDGHLDVWLTEIGSGGYRNLTEGRVPQLSNSSIRPVDFSADGTLVTLWTRTADGSQPEDIKIMAVPVGGGSLQPYLEEAAEFDWTSDGKQMVFHTTAPGDPLFVRSSVENSAHQIYLAPPGIHCHFPIWSPDREFIYFVRGEPPANWDVWRVRPSGADLERMTVHNTRVSYPVFLDQRTLLYLATDADSSGPWLYVMDVPSKVTRRVSVGLERYTSLAASANGARLVATVANSRSDLWRVTIDNDGQPKKTAAAVMPAVQSAFAPRFGPGYVAFVSTGGGHRGIGKLENGIASQLWEDMGADRVGAPAIAPDGRRVAFVVEKQGVQNLYVVDGEGRHARVVGTALGLRGGLAWAPDSQSIISAVVRDGQPSLARILLDGSPPQPMVPGYSVDPAWSPDGKYFVYSGADVGTTFPLRAAGPDGRPYSMASLILTRGARRVAFLRNSGSLVILRGELGHKNFWSLDPRTGAERQLTDLPSNIAIGDFDVSPDGTEIIFDRALDNSNIALFDRANNP